MMINLCIPPMSESIPAPQPVKKRPLKAWIFDVLLVYVLLMGAYFRFIGISWGDYQYLHPDERFLVWVGSDITPLKCLDPNLTVEACPEDQQTWMGFGEYFDAAKSTLNPVNRGHGFYVYGTLPMFMARFAVQWIYGHSGFNEMTDVGRPLSALADLLTVLLVYAIAARQYDRRVGILAAAFTAMMVLHDPAVALFHHGHLRRLVHLPGNLFRHPGFHGELAGATCRESRRATSPG